MIRASISIHIPSRTVVLGAQDAPRGEEYVDELSDADFLRSLEGPVLPYSQPHKFSINLDNSALNSLQKKELGTLMSDFSDLFASRIGRTTVAVHRIEIGDARPISLAPYRTSPLRRSSLRSRFT